MLLRKLLKSLAAVILVVAVAGFAYGGTINVSGSVDYPGPPAQGGFVSLVGDRGFTLDGVARPIPSAAVICVGSPIFCAPGTSISLLAFSVGLDLTGSATLEGVFYPRIGGGSLPLAIASLKFEGQVTSPPFGESNIAVLTAPVDFSGFFLHGVEGQLVEEQLVATAQATLTLQQIDSLGEPAWLYQGIRYDLGPVPEPTTLLLLGTTLAGLGLGGWRRRRQPDQPTQRA